LEKRIAELQILNEVISYLQQCKHYISNSAFKEEVSQGIQKLPLVLAAESASEMDQYKTVLQQLKEKYADWYLDLYLKHRISQKDDTLKQAILDSDQKAICDILKEADFLSSGQYMQWLNKIHKQQPADPQVNKNLILAAPFQDFNPLDFEGTLSFSVSQLKQELHELLAQWEEVLKETLDDPMVKKKMSLLDDSSQKLLKEFQSGSREVSKDNALRIRNAIMDLHKGLEKVELSIEDMKSNFNRPLTPDEAIDAFKAYIEKIAKGKERDKIRIILK
jgi:hypothetical protein